MNRWSKVVAASVLLSGCASDVVDDGDVVEQLPGGKSDDSCEWRRSIVDEEIGRSRGEHSTLRTDRDGFAHVVYEDRPVNAQNEVAIRYATNRSGEWVTSVVSTTCRLMAGVLDYQPLGSRSNSNFDLDADGNAYIACSDGGSVIMLDNASGAWRETMVRTPAQAIAECRAGESVPESYSSCGYRWMFGQHVALRLDSHGTPHVLYTGLKEKQYSSRLEWLEYATKEGDVWRTQSVGGGSYYFDLALDGRDRVHITAQQSGSIIDGHVFSYITNATGTWQGTTLQSAYRGSMGLFATAAVSKSGRLHAVHFNNTYYDDAAYTSALVYVRKGNGQPLVAELKRGNTLRAWEADVALDADENLHVAFHDQGALVYQTVQNDRMLAPVTVDHGGVGSHVSLALGGGTIHVTYFDEGEARLKYARWSCAQ